MRIPSGHARFVSLFLASLGLIGSSGCHKATPPRELAHEETPSAGRTGVPDVDDAGIADAGDVSSWAGKYQFSEGVTGYAMSYAIEIAKSDAGSYAARISIDGQQTMGRLICTLNAVSSDQVDLLFEASAPDDLFPNRYTKGQRLLGLQRGRDGGTAILWGAIESMVKPRAPGRATIGRPNEYIGKYPVEFLDVGEVKTRLATLLENDRARFDDAIATQLPIRDAFGASSRDRTGKRSTRYLRLEGNYPHAAGLVHAVVFYDIAHDELAVIVYDALKEKRVDVYCENRGKAPAIVADAIQEMNASAHLRVVRHE